MTKPRKKDSLLEQSAGGLAETPAKPLARVLLELVRIRRRDEVASQRETPVRNPGIPAGPFVTSYPRNAGDVLIFVPRSIESHLIDHLTGGYGYSHIAVDTGEVDLLTRKRVMIESTVNHPVWRSFLDRYGPRPFIRIPLRQMGMKAREFVECVKSKLGEPYDTLEALTWGQLDDPARQICSDLAVDCLDPSDRADLISTYRAGKLRRRSLSLHLRKNGVQGVFASPNSFAEYFGAPHGYQIHSPDRKLRPEEIRRSVWHRFRSKKGAGVPGWAVGAAVLTGVLVAGGLRLWIGLIKKPAEEVNPDRGGKPPR